MDGTIAFLERDRDSLLTAIGRLEAIPDSDENTFTRVDGTAIKMDWPPNLKVLQALEICWDKSYAEAYSAPECFRSPQDDQP